MQEQGPTQSAAHFIAVNYEIPLQCHQSIFPKNKHARLQLCLIWRICIVNSASQL
jgi:hypothetical protein